MSDPASPKAARKPRARRAASGRLKRDEVVLPLIPIRDQVYFPQGVFSILVGRERSVRAVEAAMDADRKLVLLAQRDLSVEDPMPEDLFDVGITATVMQVLRVPDGTLRVVLEGVDRVNVLSISDEVMDHTLAVVTHPDEPPATGPETEACMRLVKAQFETLVHTSHQIAPEALLAVMNSTEAGEVADTIVPYLRHTDIAVRQELLETLSPDERLQKLAAVLARETEVAELQRVIRERVEQTMGDNQREVILREQLRAIHSELGEVDDHAAEMADYGEKIAAAGLQGVALDRAEKELQRLTRMPGPAPEAGIIRNYLDWLVGLPWQSQTVDQLDLNEAVRVLDDDHYGLSKPKERIIEFLAVRRLAGDAMRGPILCFVGPPGVGKTSIGKSIARALGRRFVRISLGGVRDEAEIRGHRRTYIGAMPGRILQGIKQAGTSNPVFMLDEIDKLGMDFRGDPSSALLEALDPEQNGEFSDHYLEVPFSLRDVMFITTANLLDPIPAALRDRMEVISFTGYTELEKLAIARDFLAPKQRRENGLKPTKPVITDDALLQIIRAYTREAGVRGLEREIGSVCRKVARKVAEGSRARLRVEREGLSAMLGKPKFRYGALESADEVGAATGLVWTEFGGDTITIEVTVLPAKDGRLTLTGQLGDVMRESAQAALTYVRSRSTELALPVDLDRTREIHVHVPAGATPKDGPSAGVAIAVAVASALTGRPLRRDIAMTGEITLRGKVLPVGGIKEKVLGAHRAGIKIVALPEENRRDLDDVPAEIRAEMTFEFVTEAWQAMSLVLRPAASP